MARLLSSAPFSLIMALLLPLQVTIQPRRVRNLEAKHGGEQASELPQVRDHDRVGSAVRAARNVCRVENVVPLFADHARDKQRRGEPRLRVRAAPPVGLLQIGEEASLLRIEHVQCAPFPFDLPLQRVEAGAVSDGAEEPFWLLLGLRVLAQLQGSDAVRPAEAHICQVFSPIVQLDLERHVREGRLLVGRLVPPHTAEERHHLEADLTQSVL
mmetsp:Transcript_60495/g.143823  ORF Transcript_60495/g.143823 Transcript_60495/m.143823 type:complete len:213 (+) Transcript_60495:164-802(+)